MSFLLGNDLTLESFVEIVRSNIPVEFTLEYKERVTKSSNLVKKWTGEERIIYGVNTGFGAFSTKVISKEETAQLQKNILLSHAVSVGEPMEEESVRATMLMVLQNIGQGFSGVRLEALEMYRAFLNHGLTPYVPKEGSVGYLNAEAHIASVLLGVGRAYVEGVLLPAKEALAKIGLEPLELAEKEGLALISGTTSPTGMGALALHDMLNAAKSADIIGAMSLEVLKGTVRALDDRLMSVKRHTEQRNTASNMRRILQDSEMVKHYKDYRLQDALSLRAIPQLHGAAKKTLKDALTTIEAEINSSSDNPVIWPEGEDGLAISGCNCDSAYVGIELDSACIAATMIAKMSERRNARLINGNLSEYPSFLTGKPGLNSGLMIPQYTQAGLLNDMKILTHPATSDNIPTSRDQEDYVAMGYNAAKKAKEVANKLEYILAIELLSVYYAQHYRKKDISPGSITKMVIEKIKQSVPFSEEDQYLYPVIEYLKQFIHSGELVEMVEREIGPLQ